MSRDALATRDILTQKSGRRSRANRIPRNRRTVSITVALIFVVVLVLGPMLPLLGKMFEEPSGGISLAPLVQTLSEPFILETIWRTLLVCFFATIFSTLLGSILAFTASKLGSGNRRLMKVLPLAPLLVPNLVGAIGWVFLLAPGAGWINMLLRSFGLGSGGSGPIDIYTVSGVIWVTTLYVTPFVFSIMTSAFARTGPEMFEAYVINGTPRLVAAAQVIWGPLRPAFLAAGVLAFVESIVQFSIPLILNVNLLTTEIYRETFSIIGSEQAAAALTLPLIIFAIFAILTESRLLGGKVYSQNLGRGISTRSWDIGRAAQRTVETISVVYLVFAVILPMGAILAVSFLPYWKPGFNIEDLTSRNYESLWTSPTFVTPLLNSLLLAIVAGLVAVAVAVTISLLRHRRTDRLASALYFVGSLPLAIPSIVVGLSLLIVFTSQPFVVFYGTLFVLAFAYIIHYMPMALRNIDPLAQQMGPELEEAVMVSGGGAWRRLRDAKLPMLLPGVVTGFFMVAIFSLREFPMSVLISTHGTRVIAVTLVDTIQSGVYPEVAVLAVLLLVVNLIFVLASLFVSSRVQMENRHKRSRSTVPRKP